MDSLVEALESERDAALEDAAFERQRAEHAIARLDQLRAELKEARARVRGLIAEEQRTVARAEAAENTLARRQLPADQAELSEQLRLALDSGRRVSRERDRLRQKVVGLEAENKALRSERDRLAARVQALEGAARVRSQGA